ncbi:MAG: hypothetical protein HFJ21_02040 [Clostridia bacterium]|jgi:exopolyphosphatase/guanosine-5'-triphosphate,3'-diphosphate pyrophosphatase|nr:hypothetical protein [Clostridia bacterium]MCI9459229.1 hypothetical protein [Clostridia bacterium]
MKLSVIDLSSTGVSTVIAEGDKTTGIFETVYKDRANIAITEYMDGRGISARGIEKIIDALISARSTVKAMGADECYVISTAALRNVDNLAEVAEKVRMRTGIVINHLDGKTEAYCDLVSNRKYSAYDRVVLIDVGGGSVELCDFSKERRSEMICLDFGPLKLRNKYVGDIYPTKDEAKQIKKFLRKKCDDAGVPKKKDFSTAVLVGSINDAIDAVYREYCDKMRLGGEFCYDVYKQFVDFLLTSPDRTRLIMKAAPEKINVLPVAALILKELLKRFKLDNILISDCGVKEGYLILVATGAENAVPVDLAASVPNYAPVAPSEKKKSDKPSGKKDGKTEKSKGGKPSESGKKKTAAEKTASGKGKKPPQGKAEKPGGKAQGGAKKSGDGK